MSDEQQQPQPEPTPVTPPDQPTPPAPPDQQPTPAPDQPPSPAPAQTASPASQAATPADTPSNTADLQAEIDRLRGQLEQRDARDQAKAKRDAGGPTVDLSGDDQDARAERFQDWPEKGGSDLPQPWDHKALGLQNEERDFLDQSKPGSPNTVSPIVITHGKPLLTHGSSDPAVHELGRILGALGFHNSVSDGQNPFGSVDSTVMAAVHAFRDAYGVLEDPSGFGGHTPQGRERAAAHIGPWTWEAILRAGRSVLERL